MAVVLRMFRGRGEETEGFEVQSYGGGASAALAGLVAVAGAVSDGIDAAREATRGALDVAHSSVRSNERVSTAAIGAMERVSSLAIEANRDVAKAAITSSRLQHKEMADVAKMAIGVLSKQQEVNQKMGPIFVNALEMERSAVGIDAKERLIVELESALDDWKFVAEAPENAAVVAGRNVERLKRSIGVLKRERRREMRLARERMMVISAPSRMNRIRLARQSIAQVISSLASQKVKEFSVLFFASMALFGAVISGEPTMMSYVPLISGYIAFRAWGALNEINAKGKWMGVYMGALNQLEQNSNLTVRSAVRNGLDGALINAQRLEEIPDVRVFGDPNEIEPEIPAELKVLTNHAQEPAKVFGGL